MLSSAVPESIEAYRNRFPLKDMNRPEDIANAAVFLASSRSRTVTGTTIDVDAGESVVQQDWEVYVKKRKDALAKRPKAS